MKVEFYKIATHKGIDKQGIESPFKEYIYNIRLVGKDYFNKPYESDFYQYCTVQKNAKDAKKDIEQRLINNGVFDAALDGQDINHLM